MVNSKHKLRRNPFGIRYTREESDLTLIPIIETDSQLRLFKSVENFFNEKGSGNDSFLGLVIGSIGVGKTTSILRLKMVLNDMKNINIMYIPVINRNIAMFYGYIAGQRQYVKVFKEKWGNNDSILIFDVPDTANRRELTKLMSYIQDVFLNYKTNMIVAVNQNQHTRVSSISTIFGKFLTYTLKPFNIEETKNLIYKRLNSERDKGFNISNQFHPFNEELIEDIYELTGGNPRNLINLCHKLIESGKTAIDRTTLIEISEKEYVMDVLMSHIADPATVRLMKQLYDIIQEKFEGIAPSQRAVVEEVRKAYGWNKTTVAKRLKELTKMNLIMAQRNDEERWRIEYMLPTRVARLND